MRRALLDTNVIVRYLLGDEPTEARRAQAVIEGAGELVLHPVVILEAYFVLVRRYGVPREAAIDQLLAIAGRDNVQVACGQKAHLLPALAMARPSGRISVGDALLYAWARSDGASVRTFDSRFPGEGIEVEEP